MKAGKSGPKLHEKEHTRIGQRYWEGYIVSTVAIWRQDRSTVIICFHRCNMHDPNHFCIFMEQVKTTVYFSRVEIDKRIDQRRGSIPLNQSAHEVSSP